MKKIIWLLCVYVLPLVSVAQDIEINWSKKLEYDRKSTGLMEKFVGANEKYVYSLFAPTFKNLEKSQRTIIVYDKNTMKQMGKLNVSSSVNFKSVCVTNKVIYVLSVDDIKGKEILYVQSYTPTLETMTARKKVYQVNTSTRNASRSISTINALVNSKANDNLYIVAEKPNEKDENVELEYLVVDGNLSTLHTGQVTLPVVSMRSTASNLSKVVVGDDGMLISKNFIKADRETRKEEKLYSYAILSIIDPEKRTINSLPIKSSGKHIEDIEYFSIDRKLYVGGIYSENAGKSAERSNGVFIAVLNAKSGELEKTTFSEVNDPKINFSQLYLEKIKIHKDGKISLYATEDENVVITTRTRNGTTVSYMNHKGDILVVNLNRDGSFNWKNKIERRFTYDELYVRDIQVVTDDNDAYITYADKYRGGKRNFFNKKSKKEMRDILTYNKITTSTGSMVAQTLKLNKSNADKGNQKYVNAANITEIDNFLFLDGYQPTFKPGVKLLGCSTAILCGIGCGYLYIKSNNGSALKGGGYLGSIHLK